jgi:hypothetical protein
MAASERAMVAAVSPAVEEAVLERVRSGMYRSSEEVFTLALQLLEWAEGDPIGKRQLLRLAMDAGFDDSEAGRTVSGEDVAARSLAPARRLPPVHRGRQGRG